LKAQMPKAYNGLWEAYKELVPTLFKQVKDTTYFVRRPLPGALSPEAA